MARSRRKKSLYEVMGKTWPKSNHINTLEQLYPQKTVKDEPKTAVPIREMPKRLAQWLKRPKIVQINTGRLEFSIPYQLAIALLLGVILLILVAFRLGQWTKHSQGVTSLDIQQNSKTDQASSKMVTLSAVETRKPVTVIDKPKETSVRGAKNVVASPGDHVIVLVQYQTQADLVPAQKHFAEYGIETEIVRENNWYFLITKNRYENPQKFGTDGYKAKQKIIEAGAKYKGKAPEGYETFAPRFFRDAYGRKAR